MAEHKFDIEPRIIEDVGTLNGLCQQAFHIKTALVRAQDELDIEFARLKEELDRVESLLRGHVLSGGSLPESSKIHLKRIEGRNDPVVDAERLINLIEFLKIDHPEIAEQIDDCIRYRQVKPTTRLTYE